MAGPKEHHGLMIMLGIAKRPSSGLSGVPPPFPGSKSNKDSSQMEDESAGEPETEPDEDDIESGPDGKMTPEAAEVYHADEKCANCVNYMHDTAMCKKVSGQFKSDDGCKKNFQPLNGSFAGRADGAEAGTAYARPQGSV